MRNISDDLWDDEWFGSLDTISKIVWIGLLTKVADDQGRMLDNSNLIKSKLFPICNEPSAYDIDNTIAFFVADEKLIAYNAEGKSCLQVRNWWKYQGGAAWMAGSKYPAPEGWTDCYQYRAIGGKIKKSDGWEHKIAGYQPMPQPMPQPLPPSNPKDDLYINVYINSIKEEEEGAETKKEVFTFYSNNIELLTQYNSERLDGLITDYSAAWVLEGLKDCVNYNGKSLKYLESILKGWKAHGFRVDTRQKKGYSAPAPAPLVVPDNPPDVKDTSVPIPEELRAKMDSLFRRKTS